MEAQSNIQKKTYDHLLVYSVGQNFPQHLLLIQKMCTNGT
jgi:hypothetical protein